MEPSEALLADGGIEVATGPSYFPVITDPNIPVYVPVYITALYNCSCRRSDCSRSSQQSRGFTCDDAIEMVGFGRFQKRLLFVTGALFSADAMQMMLVSFISPAARCDFDLTIAQEALIASIVFVGMFVGSYVCGTAADKYGRRIVFLGSAACVSFFGLFSACAMFYEMLLFGQVHS